MRYFAFCCLILLKNSDKETESAHGRQRHRTNHYNEAEYEDSVRKEYEAELKESAKEALASQSQDADKTISLEKTQVFPKHKIRAAHSTVDDNEKTRLFTKEEFTKRLASEPSAFSTTSSKYKSPPNLPKQNLNRSIELVGVKTIVLSIQPSPEVHSGKP